jgi:hypothetical protein
MKIQVGATSSATTRQPTFVAIAISPAASASTPSAFCLYPSAFVYERSTFAFHRFDAPSKLSKVVGGEGVREQ